jgi:hypothetical protein
MSRQELAEAVNAWLAGAGERAQREATLDANHIGKLERGEHRWPNDLRREAFRQVLDAATDAELGFYIIRGLSFPAAHAAQPQAGNDGTAGVWPADAGPDAQPARADAATVEAAAFDAPADIARRTQRIDATNVDPATVVGLDRLAEAAIVAYDRTPTLAIARRLAAPRRRLDEFLTGHQHPGQKQRLYLVAARMSGVLAAAAMDLGDCVLARAYSVEAFQLATHAGEPNLVAWVRGTQSLIEYYAGNYRETLAYARDGQAHARGGPQTIRLALNGEARALARLNDAEGVHEAVGRGYEALARLRPERGVAAILTLGPYCLARAAANAATAYLILGQPFRVHEHAGQALVVFDRAKASGPQALTRLDLATAQLQQRQPDVESAAALAGEALRVDERRFEPLAQRSTEFLRAAAPWGGQPAIGEIRDHVHARFGDRVLPP